ncbi:YadA C-terminal domain-containing protein [Sneathia sanguinegens]|uniref:YadA C-terminal domain-containing protein n=1 Tax=Sneathia sanguinegens TaxID=40543 RepID=A0ABT7HKE4_9FUSO|nr:YadA C-terminal domain-containing protein [Sneathia sanguinegens]MDK9581000.1 YadA C-terminal domain-containing protein [Sneathia sanguinegens]
MKKIILFSCFLSVLSLAIEPKLNYAVDKNGNIIINGEKDFKNLTENSNENFLFGFGHKVKTGYHNFLIGYNNKFEIGKNSLMLGNNNDILNEGKYNNNDGIMLIGDNNKVTDSQFAFIQGNRNNLDCNYASSIIGSDNKAVFSEYSNILGHNNELNNSAFSSVNGSENKVEGLSFHSQVFGFRNKVVKGQNAFIHGDDNNIKNSAFSHIEGDGSEINNDDNTIDTTKNSTTKDSNYIFGDYNKILNSKNSYIQGYASKIENATNSSIVGGYFSSVNMNNSLAIGAFSTTKEIKNKGYLTDQDTKDVYAVSVGGKYVYKDDKGNETVYKAKRRIQGLADGAEDDEAVTVAQLKKVQKSIQNQGANEEVDKKIEGINKKSDLALSGVSNAVAIANLPNVSGDKKFNLATSYGYYGGSHSVAIGFSGINDKQNFTYKLSGSVNTKGNLALGVGAGVMLGSIDNKDKKIEYLSNEVKELRKENEEIKEILKKIMKKYGITK